MMTAVNPHFLDVSENQEFIEETDAVVECPAFFGDPQGTMIWIRNGVIVTGDRFIPEDGRLTILDIGDGDEGVYRCSIRLLGIVDSRYVTVNVLERDSLAPRIVEPSNPIEVEYGDPLDIMCELEEQRDDVQYTWTVSTGRYEDNHFKNATSVFHRAGHFLVELFLHENFQCVLLSNYSQKNNKQVFSQQIPYMDFSHCKTISEINEHEEILSQLPKQEKALSVALAINFTLWR